MSRLPVRSQTDILMDSWCSRPQEVICTFIAVPSLEYTGAADVSPLAVEIALAAKEQALENLPGYMMPKYVSASTVFGGTTDVGRQGFRRSRAHTSHAVEQGRPEGARAGLRKH